MAGRLDGKVCVITGAASGIGAEAARLFAAEGARVVGVDLDPGSPGELALQADVTDEEQVRAMYARAREELGRIDVLFNNAGISPGDDASVLETSLEAWQRVQDVNLRGVFLCCKHGIPHLLEGGGGSVINTASFVAVMGAAVSQASYTASKGGVLSLSRELGVEFARRGVRVNALCPGPVEHAAAPGAVRLRAREGGTPAGARADGALRRAAGGGAGGAFLGQRRLLLRNRLHLPGRRRPLGRLPHARVAAASRKRSQSPRPSSFQGPIATRVRSRRASKSPIMRAASSFPRSSSIQASASSAVTSAWNWMPQAVSPSR